MSNDTPAGTAMRPAHVYAPHDTGEPAVPIWLVSESQPLGEQADMGKREKAWLEAIRFTSGAKKQAIVADAAGKIAGVALGLGNGAAGEPCGPSELIVGQLASSLPPGLYHLPGDCREPRLAALAWGLGAYRFRRYKTAPGEAPPRLRLPKGVDREALENEVEAVWLARDLINTPASDMGPAELEAAARDVAKRHGAKVSAIVGDDLLAQNFPMLHAVGRANPKAPRLIDLRWQKRGGSASAPRVTLVGKGITFDTGGLDIKPAAAMLLMKKDMGGAATALALASMIMGAGARRALAPPYPGG